MIPEEISEGSWGKRIPACTCGDGIWSTYHGLALPGHSRIPDHNFWGCVYVGLASCLLSCFCSLIVVPVSDFSFCYVSVRYYSFTCLTQALPAIVSVPSILNGRKSLF